MELTQPAQPPVDEVTALGAQYYLEELRDKLEAECLGHFAVIEPVSKKYYVDADLLVALEKAEKKHPNTLFFIVEIGTFYPSTGPQPVSTYA